MLLSSADCVVAKEPFGNVTPALGNCKLNPWLEALDSIWLAVPVIAKVWALRFTSPVPESPLKSKSEALSKPLTYAVVATFVELSVDAWVVAVHKIL